MATGGNLEQSDDTVRMALYAQCMPRIAAELARHDPSDEDMALNSLGIIATVMALCATPNAGDVPREGVNATSCVLAGIAASE